jgi:ribose 5-phosphate isomerase B
VRIAFGSDDRSELTDAIAATLRETGHDVFRFGALVDNGDAAWPHVARAVSESVARGECAMGILCCWTGTGVSIAANKTPGIRAALCADAATAAGAREWNDANVLCLSLRATSVPLAREILAAWFAGAPTTNAEYRRMIDEVIAGDSASR